MHTVGVQTEVLQKVVSVRLLNIGPIKIKGEESNGSPCCDSPFNFSQYFL